MIKKFYEITIRDYNTIEQSGNIKHLVKYWFVPLFLVVNKILKEIEKVNKLLNLEVDDTEKLKWQVLSLSKINAIQASVYGILNILKLGTEINYYKNEIQRNYRRKIKLTNNNLKIYFENIKELTGIEIVTIGDLDRVIKDLEFRKDKYGENFDKPKTEGKVYLMQVVLGVFSYLNQPINMDMTISEFAIMRNEANEKLLREKNNG